MKNEARLQRLERFRAATRNIKTSTTVLLWVFSLSALGLFVASFIVPPTGVIDPSVLKAVAWIFAFAALAEAREAIMEGLGVKLTHGSTTIEVHDLDGKEGPAAPAPGEEEGAPAPDFDDDPENTE